MTWRLASKLLDDDPAFQAVEDDQERFELFEEWRRELHEREEKERAAKRQADMDRVLVYLRSREDIIASTMWSDIKDSLVDNDDFDSVDRTIILDAFKQHMLDLEEAHRQYVEQKRYDTMIRLAKCPGRGFGYCRLRMARPPMGFAPCPTCPSIVTAQSHRLLLFVLVIGPTVPRPSDNAAMTSVTASFATLFWPNSVSEIGGAMPSRPSAAQTIWRASQNFPP